MAHDIHPVKQVLAELRHAWNASSAFFLTIELWLMVLVSGVSVGGVWLAFTGDLRCLPCFGFVVAYLATRAVLHVRRIVHWPFMV